MPRTLRSPTSTTGVTKTLIAALTTNAPSRPAHQGYRGGRRAICIIGESSACQSTNHTSARSTAAICCWVAIRSSAEASCSDNSTATAEIEDPTGSDGNS